MTDAVYTARPPGGEQGPEEELNALAEPTAEHEPADSCELRAGLAEDGSETAGPAERPGGRRKGGAGLRPVYPRCVFSYNKYHAEIRRRGCRGRRTLHTTSVYDRCACQGLCVAGCGATGETELAAAKKVAALDPGPPSGLCCSWAAASGRQACDAAQEMSCRAALASCKVLSKATETGQGSVTFRDPAPRAGFRQLQLWMSDSFDLSAL